MSKRSESQGVNRIVRWKNRIILVETPDYNNESYKLTMMIYNKYIKEFEKRFFKIIVKKNIKLLFKIKIIGFDGEVKQSYDLLEPDKIFNLINKMPFGSTIK